MRLLLLTGGIFACFLTNVVLADGFFYRLPDDGAWVSYKMHGTMLQSGDMKQRMTGSLTIRSVGREVVDEVPCRWIESEWVQKVGNDERTHLTKALVPEKDLVKGHTPYAAIVKSWTSRSGGRPKQGLGADSPLLLFMSGPQVNVGMLDSKAFETALGKLEGSGTNGQLNLDEGRLKFAVDFETYYHERSPFGVLATTLDLKIMIDGRVNESGTFEYTLTDVGTDAESKLVDVE